MNPFRIALLYVRAFFRGSLWFCERCGAFTEVHPLGEGYRQHFEHLKREHGLQGDPPEELLSRISFVKLCLNCDTEVTGAAGLHRHCCDKVFRTVLRKDDADPFDHEPLDASELARERVRLVVMYKEMHGIDLAAPGSFTCDTCSDAPRCDLAFDAYNTNGDCLASK